MSGRGRTSNRGREGRGINFHKENKMKKPEVKKNLMDYNYHIGSARQASDYEVTTEFLINVRIRRRHCNSFGKTSTHKNRRMET